MPSSMQLHHTQAQALQVALENAPQRCRYHGEDFERMGMQWGQPRCESCRQPWRVVQALAALREADRMTGMLDLPA